MNTKTGILFFARNPEAEAKVKRWTPSSRKNSQLAQLLYDQTLQIIQQSDLPIFFTEKLNQQGQHFNANITQAIAAFFDQGFEQAIIIGSDCPNLSLADIQQAAANCEKGIATVGSSYDGGVYLFSLGRKDFNPQRLEQLPWCSKNLHQALVEEIENFSNGIVYELERKADFDQNALEQIQHLAFDAIALRKLVHSILAFHKLFITYFDFLVSRVTLHFSLRGPPVFSLV